MRFCPISGDLLVSGGTWSRALGLSIEDTGDPYWNLFSRNSSHYATEDLMRYHISHLTKKERPRKI